ncbi:MAG: PilC/PilY family type IV pilus protein [Thermoanaerobaculia bacterium]
MKRNNATKTASVKVARFSLGLLLLCLTPIALTPTAEADDRELFKESEGAPYLFILFDNTGSMQRRVDNGFTAARRDDDTASRLYQAKQALDQVLQGTVGVNFGFSTFPNQTGHRVYQKLFGGGGLYVRDFESRGLWCQGIETNGDTGWDEYRNYTFKWASTTTPSGLSLGDLVPLDWNDDNVRRIRERLAPNLALNESVPDYGIERYFVDRRRNNFHRLRDERARPFIASGATPLEGALRDFKSWYDGWERDAKANDPAFAKGCRSVHVVLMTDGFETCRGRPVNAARDLKTAGITTYVIGFSVANPALDAIAAAGGTVQAFSAQNQQQLVDAFNEIIGDVQRQSRTFATAAVPSVIGSASENIYLSSFSPTDDGITLWPGRVDAYKKPVPLIDVAGQQVPDRTKVCPNPDTDENCLAWDAAKELLAQAPDAVEVNSDLKIGFATGKRRVYHGRTNLTQVPENRSFLEFKTTQPEQDALYGPEGFGYAIPTPPASRSAFLANGENVIKYFLQEKVATVLDPITRVPIDVDFVMGDIFHSDPFVVAEPGRFDYFAKDLEGQIEPCGPSNDEKDRYPCFVKDQIGRRRVMLVGSNEGALHAFDAGSAFRNSDGFLEYTAGTGEELFAYVPRAVMQPIRDMSEGGGQQFTVDGPVTVDDVLRDPFVGPFDSPNPADREWRTVAIGGLREGGRGYYALDVTQPDAIDSSTGLPKRDSRGPGCTFALPSSGCDRAYPEIMWEFGDTWDEDNNGRPDLGDTWSKVNTGRIKLDDGVDADGNPKTKDLYVAVLGGGMDADFKRNPIGNSVSGNYLYMVDVETGNTVYKRRIDKRNFFSAVTTPASAPSEPAAVDTDQDSYLDTVYIGNTAGFLYKVDISEPVVLETGVKVDDWSTDDPATGSPPFVRTVDRIIDPRWEPFPIFDTGGRPIYFPPSVVFVPELARFALAFGTGDREDLWFPRDIPDPLDGRFYVLLDTGLAPDPGNTGALPLDESDLEGFVATDSTSGNAGADLLANPNSGFQSGFHLKLENTERLIAKSFGLSGVVFFSTFLPDTVSSSCGSAGFSRLYSIFAINGAGIRTNGDRFRAVGDFVTQPFVESSGAVGGKPADPSQPPADGSACSSAELQAIRTSLMSQMPAECRFAEYSLNVMTLQSQNGIECVVPIPVCVVQRNWKEF